MDKEFVQNGLEILDASTAITAGADIVLFGGIPVATAAATLIKTIGNSYLKNKQDRFAEMSSFISSNEELFKKVSADKNFQDGFIYLFDKYIFERNEEKRNILKNVLKGYANDSDKVNFPLERLINTTSQINEFDIDILNKILSKTYEYQNFSDKYFQFNLFEDFGMSIMSDVFKENLISSISHLISNNLVMQDYTSRFGGERNEDGIPFIKISKYGKEFIKYIKK